MEGRPDPDALLRQVEREEQALSQQRGKLKVFFGYATGVGKTYAMLKAAQQARKEGSDVVIGYLEPHARPETAALAENLPRLPLREIALRKAADRVNHAAQKSADPRKAPAPIAEHILIGLSAAPSNPKVIRTAARLCEAFHGRFTALYVMNSAAKAQDARTQQRLRDNMRLAEQLGARIVTVYGEDIPQQMAEYAKVSGITKIVVGRTNTRASLLRRRMSFVDRLNALTPDIDVYIIPDTEPRADYRPPRRSAASEDEQLSLRSTALALAILFITTTLSMVSLRLGFHEVFVVTLYVFGILLTAVTTGNQMLGLAMTVVSVLTYNYFFTEPYFTLMVKDPGYIMAFGLMAAISLLSGDMARRVRIEVADEGPGIPDAEKKHVFDMFYTGNNEYGDGRRGIGLGLSLCKTIVQAHGGSLSVRDRSPHGSVFCIDLAREFLTEKPEGENSL